MAEWSTNDLRTAALSNQKNVYVMDSGPTTAYDGQVWVCTSSDPPLVKVYDNTNTQWMEYHALYYEAVTSGQMPAVTPVTNGTLAVAYDTEQSSTTLFAYANGSWRDMGGALTQVYPIGDVIKTAKRVEGGVSLSWGENITLGSGVAVVLVSTNITATNSGDVACLFGGGSVARDEQNPAIRLFIGTTEVASQTVSAATAEQLEIVSSMVISNTSTNIYMDAYIATQSSQLWLTGLSLGAITVKT